MSSSDIKISVITVCLNAGQTLEACLHSVTTQNHAPKELIVIDGGSTDNTLQVIDRYRADIAYFQHQKDNGIYDAMNQGLRQATGDIVYFLNADDRFCDPTVLTDIAGRFKQDPSLDFIIGEVLPTALPESERSQENILFRNRPRTKIALLRDGLCCSQRIFMRRDLSSRIGLFSDRWPVCSDYDWLIRAYDLSPKFEFIDRKIAFYYCGGCSSHDWKNNCREKADIILQRTTAAELLEVCRLWQTDINEQTWGAADFFLRCVKDSLSKGRIRQKLLWWFIAKNLKRAD